MKLLKLRTCPAGMLSEYIIGNAISAQDADCKGWLIENPVRVFEYMVPSGQIVLNYTADTLFSIASVVVNFSDVSFSRDLTADDSAIASKYEESMSQARLAKAGLLPASGAEKAQEVVGGKI